MREALNIDEIKEGLKTKYVGEKIHYIEETTSTNDEAKKMAETGEADGTIIISEYQTSGRGRMLRNWETRAYESIALSIIVRPDISVSEVPTITPVLALSIVEGLKELDNIDVSIKWPNDIFLGGRKLGGILTEVSTSADRSGFIVIGMGLNIEQDSFGDELDLIATSIKKATGKTFSREMIISNILNRFECNLDKFLKHGLSCFSGKLKEYSCIIGKDIIVISGLEMVEGFALDIDESGNLLLRTEDGRIKKIIYGEVSIKLKELLKG